MNENNSIDRIAQWFFVSMITCSVMCDSYISVDKIFKNNYIKKKCNYFKKIYKIIVGLTLNTGEIVIEDDDHCKKSVYDNSRVNIEKTEKTEQTEKSKNPFDEEIGRAHV